MAWAFALLNVNILLLLASVPLLPLYSLYLCTYILHIFQALMDVYFLSAQKTRPSLFGTPIIIPRDENTTCQDLYHFVWVQVSRLVSPLPPSEQRTTNHALDWYGCGFPVSWTSFTLTLIAFPVPSYLKFHFIFHMNSDNFPCAMLLDIPLCLSH